MCLAVPMEVVAINDGVADVEMGGVRRQVRIDICDEKPVVGDFVIVHAGYALRRIDREEGIETIRLFELTLDTKLL